MNPEIATIERVRSAAAQLRSAGEAVTADRVIAKLGGGSKSTVLKHLKSMRCEADATAILPTAILEAARPLLSEVFAAGELAGDERHRAKLQVLNRSLEELEEQVEEMAAENASLRSSNAMLSEERDAAVRLRQQAEERLDGLTKDNAVGRSAIAVELGSLVERLEATVTAVQDRGGRRPTLTLKDGATRASESSSA